MARTRQQLDEIRAVNRAKLGLAGVGALGVTDPLGLALQAAIPSVRVVMAFPATDYTYQPGATAPDPSSEGGSGISTWFLQHVNRPEVYIGDVRFAPYDSYADYSGIFQGLAYAVGIGGAAAFAWMLVRALFPRARFA